MANLTMYNYIVLNGTKYTQFSEYYSADFWAYLEEPTRANDGVIYNLNEYERVSTFNVILKFNFIDIKTFRQLLKDLSMPEFTVQCFNTETGKQRTEKMYVHPIQQQTLLAIGNKARISTQGMSYNGGQSYNDGVLVKGITNLQIQLVSTNTSHIDKDIVFTFLPNGGTGTAFNITDKHATIHTIPDGMQFTRTGYYIKWWNTNADDSGIRYYKNEEFVIGRDNVNLYAIWGVANG